MTLVCATLSYVCNLNIICLSEYCYVVYCCLQLLSLECLFLLFVMFVLLRFKSHWTIPESSKFVINVFLMWNLRCSEISSISSASLYIPIHIVELYSKYNKTFWAMLLEKDVTMNIWLWDPVLFEALMSMHYRFG